MHLIKALKEKGWTQGSILDNTKESISVLDKGLYFVLTHPCDILHADIEEEPDIEVIKLDAIPETNGNFTKAKNLRKLHIKLQQLSDNAYELTAKNRKIIDKNTLNTLSPLATCSDHEIDRIISWWSSRYDRTPFPNEFNNRLKLNKFETNYQNKLKTYKSEIENVYVQLNTGKELSVDKNYEIRLLIHLNEKISKDVEIAINKEVRDWLMDELPKIKIDVASDARAARDYEITLSDIKDMRIWYLEFLSQS